MNGFVGILAAVLWEWRCGWEEEIYGGNYHVGWDKGNHFNQQKISEGLLPRPTEGRYQGHQKIVTKATRTSLPRPPECRYKGHHKLVTKATRRSLPRPPEDRYQHHQKIVTKDTEKSLPKTPKPTVKSPPHSGEGQNVSETQLTNSCSILTK